MESKIQAHTVSPPHTRLPLTTFLLYVTDFRGSERQMFYPLYISLIWGSEWSVVLEHLF